MSQSITVTVAKLMTIPEQTAPPCVNQRITELKGSISEKSQSLIDPQTIDREISLLEEKLGDGKIWQTSMIWKTALAAGTIYFTVRTGTKQISRGDSVGKVLSWSALRISVTYIAVQSAIRSIQKWPTTRKCIGEIIAGNLKESPFSRLTTILFPFVSRRLDRYNADEISHELDNLKQEKNEIPTKNEAAQREINKLESQVKRVELLKTNFPTLFGSFIKEHGIYKRLEGRLDEVFIETTSDGQQLPLEKDNDWKNALNSYSKKAPDSREVNGALIPKLTEDEIRSLYINNIIAVVKNIAEKNPLFDSFATHHRTTTVELVNTFASTFLSEIQNSNDTNEQILTKLIKKSNYTLNLPHSGESNLQGHTPAPQQQVSRLRSDDDTEDGSPSNDPLSPTVSTQQGQRNFESTIPRTPRQNYSGTGSNLGVPSADSSSALWEPAEEGNEDFEIHISDQNDPATPTPEENGFPVPDRSAFREQAEFSEETKMQYLERLKTPDATKNSVFTPAQQTAAKLFAENFVELNPQHPQVQEVKELLSGIKANTPGTPEAFTRLITRIKNGRKIHSLVIEPNILGKE